MSKTSIQQCEGECNRSQDTNECCDSTENEVPLQQIQPNGKPALEDDQD